MLNQTMTHGKEKCPSESTLQNLCRCNKSSSHIFAYSSWILQNIFRAMFLMWEDEQNILCRCVQFNLCFNERNNDLALFSCRIMCDKPNNSEAWLWFIFKTFFGMHAFLRANRYTHTVLFDWSVEGLYVCRFAFLI